MRRRPICLGAFVSVVALAVTVRAEAQSPRDAKPADKGARSTPPVNAEVPAAKPDVKKPVADGKSKPEPKPTARPERKPEAKPEPKGEVRPNAKPGAKVAPAEGGSDIALTAGREAAALTFARLHHPELADLLEHLKKADRNEYERAVKELFQASEKLARVKERNPERYDLALRLWKLDSRIRLLVARMTMSDDPALESELAALLRERAQTRVAELREERGKAAARIAKIDEEITRIERDGEQSLERELEQIRKHLTQQVKATKKAAPRKSTERAP